MPESAAIAYLVAEAGGLRQVYALTHESTTIGRISRNDIRLPFTTISRQHAAVVRTPMGFKVLDVQSRNGIYVNDLRVMEKFLLEGDRLQIGEVVMTFTLRDPAHEDPAQKSDTGSMPAVAPSQVPNAGPSAFKPETRRHAAPPRARAPRRSAAPVVLVGILSALLTGLVFALIFKSASPPASSGPAPASDRGAVADRLKLQEDRIDAALAFQREEGERLRIENERLSAEIVQLNNRIVALNAQLAELDARLGAIVAALSALARRPAPESHANPSPEAPPPGSPGGFEPAPIPIPPIPDPFGPGGPDDEQPD